MFVKGVCGGKDGSMCVKSGGDISFGNGDGLLFYDFVNGGMVRFFYFVKFIDIVDIVVGENKSIFFCIIVS